MVDRFTFYTLAFFERLNMYDNASLSRYNERLRHMLEILSNWISFCPLSSFCLRPHRNVAFSSFPVEAGTVISIKLI